MFDFSQLAKTGEMVVDFINQANARLSAMATVLSEVRAQLAEHRTTVEPQVARLEQAHKEIFDWIADIEGGEIVEAAATVEAAVVQAETAAATAVAAESGAVAAAETVAVATVEAAVAETPPEPETPPAPPLEETPIPPPPEEPKERKRHFLSL